MRSAPSAPLGLVRGLLRLKALPLYPEQRTFERHAAPGDVRTWRADVDRRMRGEAVAELRSVLPAARDATLLTQPTLLEGVPVQLITSKAYGPEWVRMHDDMAARYAGSRHRYTGDRHHNVAMVHPDLVTATIRDTVAVAAGLD